MLVILAFNVPIQQQNWISGTCQLLLLFLLFYLGRYIPEEGKNNEH